MSDLTHENPKQRPTCDQILLERKKYFITYSDIKHDSQIKRICNEFWKSKPTNLAQKILLEKINSELLNNYDKKLSLEGIYIEYNEIKNFSNNRQLVIESNSIDEELKKFIFETLIQSFYTCVTFNEVKQFVEKEVKASYSIDCECVIKRDVISIYWNRDCYHFYLYDSKNSSEVTTIIETRQNKRLMKICRISSALINEMKNNVSLLLFFFIS
jgi:hypothetical protein